MDRRSFERAQELDKILFDGRNDGPITDARRALFEEYLSIYATYPPIWEQYISEEMELGPENDERVMRLFYRALPVVPKVSLFQNLYIPFVSRRSENRQEICAAYEYAISQVGLDIGAIGLYRGYTQYAKQVGEQIVPIDKLRRVYQRALTVPMDGLKEFHADYQRFEREKKQDLANAILPEQERRFKATASVYHEKKRVQKQLEWSLCRLDDANGFDSLHKWWMFIKFERDLRLQVSTEQHRGFVVFAYKCALCVHRFCALLWNEYGQFMLQEGEVDEALAIYKQAIDVLPLSPLLHFTYAELLESRKRSGEAKHVYQGLIDRLADPEHIKDYTLATIFYLKFLQRTEGPNSMRQVFVCALNKMNCTFHLLLEVASMENLVNENRDAAFRILMYGVGDTKYGKDPIFIENVIKQLLKMGAVEQVMSVIGHAKHKRLLSEDKLREMYELLFDDLLFKRDKDALLNEVEQEILRLNPSETSEAMSSRRYFQPKNCG